MKLNMSKKNWLIVILVLTNFIALGYIATLHARQYILTGLTQSELSPYSAELQQAYRKAIEPNWFELMKAVRAIKFDKKKLHDLMIAEKLDHQAIRDQQAELRLSQMNLIEILHDALPEALENISAEERSKIPNASLRSFTLKNDEIN